MAWRALCRTRGLARLRRPRQAQEATGRGAQRTRMVRIGASRREKEAGRSEPLGDARQRSEVPRGLEVIQEQPYLPGTRRDAGEVCPRQGADGEQTARRVG